MKVVALISGGKDSCYSAMQCAAAGHSLVALANLQPEGKEDELDSFMFQTVGHEAVQLVADAMGLPLYRSATSGRSKGRGLQYTQQDGDEVEDLFHLLQRVQRLEGVEGVASGAILSDYQRLRVEHVCDRLGLKSLAYLWRREQGQLLDEMISSGLTAILVKVAAIGLKESHLGCTLQEMRPHLSKLSQRFGVHMCGEGGEYETLTLDCPLFTHTIVIDESEVVQVTPDDLAPVAYLKLKTLHLKPKPSSVERRTLAPLPTATPSQEVSCEPVSQCVCSEGVRCEGGRVWRWAVFEGKGEDLSHQTSHVLSELSNWVDGRWSEVVLTHLFLSNIEDFFQVNCLYQQSFSSSPPARVCVQMTLPPGVLLRLETLTYHTPPTGQEERVEAMHVQSISCWAPANIGPYSQAVRVGMAVLLAGQIGLVPRTMTLAPSSQQPSLSLRHSCSVLEANHSHLTSALCGTCYYTTEEAGWAARMTWIEKCREISGCGPVMVFVRVPALPRGACVEWSFTSLTSSHLHRECKSQVVGGVGLLAAEEVIWRDGDECKAGAWLFSFAPVSPAVSVCEAVEVCARELALRLTDAGLSERDITRFRVFLPRYSCCPPPTSLELGGLFGATGVTTAVCEGYFGQNSCLSLLALLLPSSQLTHSHITNTLI